MQYQSFMTSHFPVKHARVDSNVFHLSAIKSCSYLDITSGSVWFESRLGLYPLSSLFLATFC